MSTSLPQEVQTSKVTTLPDDLKAIAEEMLKEKFGVKEVQDVSPDPFPDDYPKTKTDGQDAGNARATTTTADAWCGNSFCSSCVGGPERGCGGFIQTRVDFQRRQRVFSIAISQPDSRVFHDGINKMQRELNVRPHEITLRASKPFLQRMLSDPEAQYFFKQKYEPGHRDYIVGQMFGVNIAVVPEGSYAVLEARF